MRKVRIETVAVLAVAVFAAALLSACGNDRARASAAALPAETAVVPVTVATAFKRDVPVVVRATGTFIADESSDVAAQVSGPVLKTLVNVGDIVEAGQPLVLLDDRDARLRLDEARASLDRADADAQHAKTDASRSRELFQKGFTPQSDFDRLVAQDKGAGAVVTQVRAQIASAQKAVDDTIVRAPFSGHVTMRPVAAGEYVTPASKIATIIRIQPIKLQLQVKEADAVKIRRGQTVQAEVSGYPAVPFIGSVSALNVAIDPSSRAMMVEVTFPNTDARITPGMFATAVIRLSATESAVFTPREAAVRVAGADAMYVIEGGKAQLRVVQLGESLNGMIRVVSSLPEGAVVATNNFDKLFDGATVRASTAPGAAAPTEHLR